MITMAKGDMAMESPCLFVGSKQLGLRALQAACRELGPARLACAALDDSNDSRSCYHEFETFCRSAQIPLHTVRNNTDLLQVVKEVDPAICLVVGWYLVLGPGLLKEIPGGWLGLHASLLPRYRGFAPLVWAIINGESQTGVTLFYFAEGMDAGDIVDQGFIPIGKQETIADILAKAEVVMVELIKRNLIPLLEGRAVRRAQNQAEATYCAMRRPEDGQIDWTWEAKRAYNFIRAQTRPYPGAYSFLPSDQGNRKITIWRCRPFENPFWGTPGLVAQAAEDGVVVCCGENALEILEVQPAGEEPRPAREVLRFGARLGEIR